MTRLVIDIPKETLEYLYWTERLSIKDIAEKLGIGYTTTYYCFEKHNIRRRTQFETKQLKRGRTGISAEELRELYVEKQLPIMFLAAQLQTSPKTLKRLCQEYGIPLRTISEANSLSAPQRLRDKDGHGRNWKGGRFTAKNGYIMVYDPNYHRGTKNGYAFEHLQIWEKAHGKVPKGWVVHHLNGNKADNRLENLVAMSKSTHAKQFDAYNKRIRQLEARIAELEAQLKNHNLFTLSPPSFAS